jgi:general secretion pathway protein K
MMKSLIHQKASALLMALFITAIAAIMATAVIYKFRILVHLATLNNATNQSYLYLVGLIDQSEHDISLYANSWSQSPSQDSPNLTVPKQIGPQKFENKVLTATITDAQGLYNINNLASANNQARFVNLLRYVLPKMSQEQDIKLTEYITDWLAPGNATDQIYARLDPPYRAAHRPMQNISELRLIAGITPEIFSALAPYIVALPSTDDQAVQTTAININTAPPVVLLTLSPQMDIEKAQSLYECRRGHGVFFSTADYNRICGAPLGLGELSGIATHSNYFLVHSSATNRTQQVLLSALLSTQQNQNSKQYNTYTVWQMSG